LDTLADEKFDLLELEATEADANGSHVYLSVDGFLLRHDVQIQENIDTARVFFRSFLKCLKHIFVNSLILKSFPSSSSFPSSRLMALIHVFFLNSFCWEIESTKLLTRPAPDNLS